MYSNDTIKPDTLRVDHILEKGSSPVNEDRLLIGKDLFGVFDGATSLASGPEGSPTPGVQKNNSLPNLLTGGAMAAGIARETFAANHYPLTRLARQANTAIFQQMADQGINLQRPEQIWSTSAAVVRFKHDGLEWFRTGDAQILLVYGDGSHQALGRLIDHDYPTLSMMKSQRDNTLKNPVLLRQVLKVRQGMNKTYGVLNGDDRADRFFNSGLVSLDGVSSVLLFTDGLTLPSETPSPKPDFSPLVKDFITLGLQGLHRKIRTLENNDKTRKKYPRFKCHDDIAAVAISL